MDESKKPVLTIDQLEGAVLERKGERYKPMVGPSEIDLATFRVAIARHLLHCDAVPEVDHDIRGNQRVRRPKELADLGKPFLR